MRKRGPRSRQALVKRFQHRKGGKPSDAVSGESETVASVLEAFSPQSIRIYSINIRCLLANINEVIHHVQVNKPHLILIQESWLNASIEQVHIPDYIIISRRDRKESDNRGGIIVFAQANLRNVVHISNSNDAERSWHYLHSDLGIIAICNWYRPPGSPEIHISSLRKEIDKIKEEAQNIVIMGDLNIHHAKWLFHSNGISSEGIKLKEICDDYSLMQVVREPRAANTCWT